MAYRFLDIPMTARTAALGGANIALWGDDIDVVVSNPSLLNSRMAKQATLNYCNYVGNLNFGYAGYAHDLKKDGTIAGGIQFFNYGKMKGYDEFGQAAANFNANDYSLNFNYARSFEDSSFQIGAVMKTIISQYDIYTSVANAFDLGITYHNKKDLVATVVLKNIGWVYKSHSNTLAQKESLPQNVQLGLSYKVAKAPFRIMAAYDQLARWNLRYISPIDTAQSANPFNTDETPADSTKFQKFGARFNTGADNTMRHILLGTEFLVSKNFTIRLAYNYRRQREMTLPERRGVNGLSFGFGMKIKRMSFSYSFTKMAFAGNSSILGLTYNL